MKIALCPGSCGELFQGKIDGITIQITCPINIYSRSTAKLSAGGVKVPPGKDKVKAAIELFLERRQITIGVEIGLSSGLSTGTGMSGSSADIFASLQAVARLLSLELSIKEAAALALSIEPTDGVLLKGIAQFDYYGGRVAKTIGTAPRLGVVLLDFGGSIDTVSFASHKIEYTAADLKELEKAFFLVKSGIVQDDYRMLGAGTILSARVNQGYLFKPQLEKVISAAAALKAYGVNVAHSGTLISVLVDNEQLEYFRARFTLLFPAANVSGAHIIGGGIINNVCDYY